MNEELKTMFALAKESSEKDADNERLREENERLRKALVDIRDSRHCEYYVNGVSPYGVGVTDGHRCCSRIARVALEESEKEVGDE